MKFLKPLSIFLMMITLVACNSDDDNDNPFLLTNENLAGIYDLNFLFANIETTVVIEGLPLTVMSTSEGSVFEVEAVFNQNGTFTLVGQFLLTSNVPGSDPVEDIILLDENGTFQLNDTLNTISIISSEDLLNGTFDVTLFTENELRIIKEEITIEGSVTTEKVIQIRFTRK